MGGRSPGRGSPGFGGGGGSFTGGFRRRGGGLTGGFFGSFGGSFRSAGTAQYSMIQFVLFSRQPQRVEEKRFSRCAVTSSSKRSEVAGVYTMLSLLFALISMICLGFT
jgi:hypothetical protein